MRTKKHNLRWENGNLYCDDNQVKFAGNGGAVEYNGVITAAVELTKDLVEALLERNENNRHMSTAARHKLENSLVNSGLVYSPEQGIGVSKSWVLLNGQHRLEALRTAWDKIPGNKIIHLSIGEDDSAYEMIDRQRKRSLSDVLRKPLWETSVLKNIAVISVNRWDPTTVTKAMYDVLERRGMSNCLACFNFKSQSIKGSYDAVKTGVLLYCLMHNTTYYVDHLQEILEGQLLETDEARRLNQFWTRRSDLLHMLQSDGVGRPKSFFSRPQDLMNTYLSMKESVPDNLRSNYTNSPELQAVREFIKNEMESTGKYVF